MNPEDLRKKLQSRTQAVHDDLNLQNAKQAAFIDALTPLIDTTIKPAFTAFAKVIPADHSPRVEYNELISSAVGRRPAPYNDIRHAIASFHWTFGVMFPKLGQRVGVGFAPIHILASPQTERACIIAWDYRQDQDKYALCAELSIDEITHDRIVSILTQVADNMIEYRPLNTGLR